MREYPLDPAMEMSEAEYHGYLELDDEWDRDDLECTHCGGDGECDANANPLWDCDDQPHLCHACGGTGKRRDQRFW